MVQERSRESLALHREHRSLLRMPELILSRRRKSSRGTVYFAGRWARQYEGNGARVKVCPGFATVDQTADPVWQECVASLSGCHFRRSREGLLQRQSSDITEVGSLLPTLANVFTDQENQGRQL
jgi:hypothetical protein